MKKYEYNTITLGMNDCLDLNQLGDEGWEMCGVFHADYKITYYFKKKKHEKVHWNKTSRSRTYDNG